ncbi:MAG: cobalamin biosynthesis protein, partial [Pseudomonadota bacterium]
MEVTLMICLALALDYLLGEPRQWHPLVIFGGWVDRIESKFNQGNEQRQSGVIAWCLAVLPIVFVALPMSVAQTSCPFNSARKV